MLLNTIFCDRWGRRKSVLLTLCLPGAVGIYVPWGRLLRAVRCLPRSTKGKRQLSRCPRCHSGRKVPSCHQRGRGWAQVVPAGCPRACSDTCRQAPGPGAGRNRSRVLRSAADTRAARRAAQLRAGASVSGERPETRQDCSRRMVPRGLAWFCFNKRWLSTKQTQCLNSAPPQQATNASRITWF